MKKLYIGFSKPRNKKFPIISWLIRLFENTPYSHVYIRWNSDYLERSIIYQASGSSVNFEEGRNFIKKNEILTEFELLVSEDIEKNIKQKAMDLCNISYGIKQISGLLLVKLFKLFNKNIQNPFSDGSATYVCSELVADLLIVTDFESDKSLDNITPKDIYNYFNNCLDRDTNG